VPGNYFHYSYYLEEDWSWWQKIPVLQRMTRICFRNSKQGGSLPTMRLMREIVFEKCWFLCPCTHIVMGVVVYPYCTFI